MRIMLLAVNCLATLTFWLADTSAFAQQRSVDSLSQRILPLPESELSDSQTQMELLKRLRSLIAGHEEAAKEADAKADDSPGTKNAPAIDEQQLDQLQQALKNLQDQLPPGIKPPELDSIPKEQLDQAMSNPAVQQQLKKMLEQFSKDGLLPKTDNSGDKSQSPTLPRPNGPLPKTAAPTSPFDRPSALEPRFSAEPESTRPPESQGQQETPKADSEEPQPKPAEKSWQSLKDAMKKLADIAQGEKNAPRDTPPHNGDGQTPDISEMPSDPKSDSPNGNSPQGDPPATDEPERGDSEKKEQSLKTLQDLLERFKNSQRDQPNGNLAEGAGPQINNDDFPSDKGTDDNSASPATDSAAQRPQNGRSTVTPSSPSSDASNRVLRRTDRSSPMIPPPGTAPRSSQQGEVFPPMPLPPRASVPQRSPVPQNPVQPPQLQPDRAEPRTGLEPQNERSSPTSPEAPSSGLFPSVSEFIKEQIQKGLSTPADEDGVAKSNTQPQNPRPGDMNAGGSKSSGAGSRNSSNRNPGSTDNVRNGNAPSGVPGFEKNSPPPDLDVRKELENRGFRGTFERIVQKAKEESRARQQQESVAGQAGITPGPQDLSVVPARPSGGTPAPNDAGMQKSLGDLLSGLDDDLQDIAKDAKFNTPPMDDAQSRNPSTQSPSPNSDSSLGKIRDAASGFFSDLSKAPQATAPPSPSNSGSGGGSVLATDAPFAIGSIFFVACALIGVGGMIAYLMRKPLMKLVTDATGVTRGHSKLQPGEIQTRADVIAAFHDLALSPRQAVESWWTHRAAAQKLGAESPQSRQAVDTLAEIYEQARYLPDNVVLPADRIQSARTALAECR